MSTIKKELITLEEFKEINYRKRGEKNHEALVKALYPQFFKSIISSRFIFLSL